MTNEDILEQICHDCAFCKDCGFRSRELVDRCHKIEVVDYALKVKDQQFKEYLEKKKRCLSLRSDWSAYENTIYNDCLAEIINELFKEG